MILNINHSVVDPHILALRPGGKRGEKRRRKRMTYQANAIFLICGAT
jgi:hypothetical protein